MIFNIILYARLHKQIGQKLLKEARFSCLGIRTKKKSFKALETNPFTLDSSTTANKSYLMRPIKARKNYMVQPPGPRLLDFRNPSKTTLSSLKEIKSETCLTSSTKK
jgi:hypothetical protein